MTLSDCYGEDLLVPDDDFVEALLDEIEDIPYHLSSRAKYDDFIGDDYE